MMGVFSWIQKGMEASFTGLKIEIDPSKRIADVNQLDNTVVID